MVEHVLNLDSVFGALADPTRRDILKRIGKAQLSISEIAKFYDLTFAAISKHLKVLENARLILKHRKGKQQIVELSPVALRDAASYLQEYEKLWNNRLDSLEEYLKTIKD